MPHHDNKHATFRGNSARVIQIRKQLFYKFQTTKIAVPKLILSKRSNITDELSLQEYITRQKKSVCTSGCLKKLQHNYAKTFQFPHKCNIDKVDLIDNFIIHITETIAMSIKTTAHSMNLRFETKFVINQSPIFYKTSTDKIRFSSATYKMLYQVLHKKNAFYGSLYT